MIKQDLRGLPYSELISALLELEFPKFRGDQLFSWLHKRAIASLSDASNLPRDLEESLEKDYWLSDLTLLKKQVSQLDGTEKYLFALHDQNAIETVLMKYKYGNTVCISTQVGCRMGCGFCASTLNGLVRNLTAGEIALQVYMIEKLSGEPVSNVVLMGIGEPLDNFSEVIRFIEIISHPKGRNLGQRHIALSTCGMVDKIYELANLAPQVTLCISLHAVDNQRRSQIMPINNKWGVDELISASKSHFEKTGRRVTFEYALMAGVNDSPEEATALAKLLEGMNCHVNLIPINEVGGSNYKKSKQQSILDFKNILAKQNVSTTIRRELGSDISAACGQLRHEFRSTSDSL